MAKNPAFLFYAQDFLVDTLRWTRDMKSLHVDLLCESWINGPLKNDKGFPSGLNDEDRATWKKIKSKWKIENNEWFNEKMEMVRAARNKFIAKQTEKGKKSAELRKKVVEPNNNHGSTVVEPIENENENPVLKIIKEPENSIDAKLAEAFDEIYLDQEPMNWRHLDFNFELESFKNKVRGSPEDYITRDRNGIRKAFQYQLRNSKGKKNGTTSKNDRSEHNANELAIIAAHVAASRK